MKFCWEKEKKILISSNKLLPLLCAAKYLCHYTFSLYLHSGSVGVYGEP